MFKNSYIIFFAEFLEEIWYASVTHVLLSCRELSIYTMCSFAGVENADSSESQLQ